jgi:hypothetical protein
MDGKQRKYNPKVKKDRHELLEFKEAFLFQILHAFAQDGFFSHGSYLLAPATRNLSDTFSFSESRRAYPILLLLR